MIVNRATRVIEAFAFRHRDRLVWLHAATAVAFIAVIVVPVFLPDPPGNATPLNHWVTSANYALWGLWFPLVFLSVIVTGRSWCGLLCPMGAAAEWANKYGPKRAVPGWLKWEGTPVVSFLIITILGQTVGVRDHPEAALEVFGGTMLAAVLLGWLYGRRKRAWCRHVCPIGLLLGVFSRIGAVQFAPKVKRDGGDAWTEKGVCPTMIDLPRKEESRHCIQCFRCVNPQTKGSLELRLRTPGAEIERIRHHNPNAAEVWFLFLGTGIALGGFLWLVLPEYQQLRQAIGIWAVEREMFWISKPGPWWLMSVHPERREVFVWLDFFLIVGFMLLVMTAMAVALGALTAMAAWLGGLSDPLASFRKRFVELGYQYAPVAMVSLVVGLGGALFEPLGDLAGAAKGVLFAGGILWSLWLGWMILAFQGLGRGARLLALVPGLIGTFAVALSWWPAIFGP
ncbi:MULTISPECIES: 4Fe-4S binding protein [Azospirillum]|uniref:4Fe-4S binding protein n=1 Tax=Azospirillum brasilense TaxID=192 RepID=A0ABU4PEB1_AZOBR|nr:MULTISPECIES: 4Fe-4S binding protein [Azospirillum]ALJ39437.1 ferredoxin [Azospirillum brasilense]MDX5955942.1 4Fe-4S binding protein [Azospirillum brasilense]PWC88165.1 ferredoxin [Azospirillum sp. Sp 7]